MAWLLWNLFLAALPIPFGIAVGRRLRDGSGTAGRRAGTVALALMGLLLLPNAPYLLTEIRHFVLDSSFRELTARAMHEPAALRLSALWGALFVGYGGIGLAAYVVAVRPAEAALAARGFSRVGIRAALTPTVALGVWLGLVPRFNSWDVLTDPCRVLGAAGYAATHVATAASILGFALVLCALHAAGDLVADHVERRLRPSGAPQPTAQQPARGTNVSGSRA